MSFSATLTDAVRIEKITRTNVDGESVASIEVVARAVACQIQEEAGEVRLAGGSQALQYDATGWFDPEIDLRPRDTKGGDQYRVTVLESGDQRLTVGTVYTVVHAIPSPGVRHHVEVRLRRLASANGA